MVFFSKKRAVCLTYCQGSATLITPQYEIDNMQYLTVEAIEQSLYARKLSLSSASANVRLFHKTIGAAQ